MVIDTQIGQKQKFYWKKWRTRSLSLSGTKIKQKTNFVEKSNLDFEWRSCKERFWIEFVKG